MASPVTPMTHEPRYTLTCGCSLHIEDQDDTSRPALSFVYCSRHAAADTIYEAARNLARSITPLRDGSGNYTLPRDAHRVLVDALLDANDGNRAAIYAPAKD